MSNEFVVLSDIHGNAPALQAVIDHEGYDKEYVILGDIMGLNAYPSKTQELVQSLDGHVLAGNHDKAIFHEGVGHVNSAQLSEFELSHTLLNLSHEQIDWMQELPHLTTLTRAGERICAAHAYPWPEKASGYESGNRGVTKGSVPQVASIVADDYDWVFLGHTHEQYSLDCAQWGNDVHFVNPGSLGWNHEYAVVDVATGDVSLKSVEVEADVQSHVQEHLPEGAPHTNEWFDS